MKSDVEQLSPTLPQQAKRLILGESPSIARIRDLIAEIAPTDAKVLIVGESGTGKELVARAIHEQSLRAAHPFIPVNMAALPSGLVESMLFGHEKGAFTGADCLQKGWAEMADRGTLFLDEIGEMDVALQAKLLRFLQESSFQRVGSSRLQTVDVRILAATNREPAALVREGRLREDLYYRLNVLPIAMPALRERREDIPILANWLLAQAAQMHHKPVVGFTDGCLDIFHRYDWPGNVRQLENLVQRLVILAHGPEIGVESLPTEMIVGRPSDAAVLEECGAHVGDGLRPIDQIEKRAIIDALSRSGGNAVEAARMLGVGQATVYRKIKRYGIELKRHRHAKC
jgi:DNA-binding NtrC family response regulator